MKMNKIVEICTGSYQDCLAAEKGGASRVELNSALSVGGLTPSLATLRKVKRDTSLNVVCMVRPRAAGFCYDDIDTDTMMEDARILLENGADGIAFGFLNEDFTIHTDKTKKMVDLIHSYNKTAVFHRAYDVCKDPYKAIEDLIQCGVDRLLTSGLEAKAIDGTELLHELQNKYGNDRQILAGSGVNAKNANKLIEETGLYQVHSSCKSYYNDPTTKSEKVSYAYLSGEHICDYDIVDVNLVKNLVEVVEK